MNKLRARSDSEKQLRREKLLSSAKKHFSLHGYEATTIKMIAGAEALSPGTFYQYFDSKLEIYRTLSIMGVDILEKMITESITGGERTGSEKIAAIAEAYYSFFKYEREYYDIIAINHLGVREFFSNVNLVPLLEEQTKNLLKLVSSIISDGMAAGEFRPVDPWKTAVCFWGIIDGILILEVKKSTQFVKITLPELVKHMTGLVLGGLKCGIDI